jgi:alkylated DNA repair dioxygenase AlkB
MERKYLDSGGVLDYDPEFLLKDEADRLYDRLYAEANWEQKYFTVRKTGVKYPLTRLTAFYADDDPKIFLSYSGITHEVQPWIPCLLEVKAKIEKITGASYNTVLLNMYQTGDDHLNAHADDYNLGPNPNIASISLGSCRAFVMAQYHKNPEWKPESGIEIFKPDNHKFQYNLAHGSLLVMSGSTQEHWTHEVPKMVNVGPRISLTFRKFIV